MESFAGLYPTLPGSITTIDPYTWTDFSLQETPFQVINLNEGGHSCVGPSLPYDTKRCIDKIGNGFSGLTTLSSSPLMTLLGVLT